jgi:hypothetical protein
MVRFGSIFRKNYGSDKPRFRQATPVERRKINEDETLDQATRRQAESYFGRPYDSLTMQQKRYARQRARDFRKNVFVRE